MDIVPPGLRPSPTTSPNCSKTNLKLLASLNAAIRRKTSIAWSPFSYVRYPGIRNLVTGNTSTCSWELIILFKRIWCGNWPKPLEALALKWFYMLFHKNDCNKFITAGKKLETKTFESVTKFFEAQFTTNKNGSTLKCMELELIKKHAHLKLKNKLCNKICTRKDNRCTYQAQRKIASCDARCCPYNKCKEQH